MPRRKVQNSLYSRLDHIIGYSLGVLCRHSYDAKVNLPPFYTADFRNIFYGDVVFGLAYLLVVFVKSRHYIQPVSAEFSVCHHCRAEVSYAYQDSLVAVVQTKDFADFLLQLRCVVAYTGSAKIAKI